MTARLATGGAALVSFPCEAGEGAAGGWGRSSRCIASLRGSKSFRAPAARESLSLACPRESNQREGHPTWRFPGIHARKVREGRPGFSTGHPAPAKNDRHPCRSPCGPVDRPSPPHRGPGRAARILRALGEKPDQEHALIPPSAALYSAHSLCLTLGAATPHTSAILPMCPRFAGEGPVRSHCLRTRQPSLPLHGRASCPTGLMGSLLPRPFEECGPGWPAALPGPLCGGETESTGRVSGHRQDADAFSQVHGRTFEKPGSGSRTFRAGSPESAKRGGLSFGYFSLATQRKVTRAPQAHESFCSNPTKCKSTGIEAAPAESKTGVAPAPPCARIAIAPLPLGVGLRQGPPHDP